MEVQYPKHIRTGIISEQHNENSNEYWVEYDERRHKNEYINLVSLSGRVKGWNLEGFSEWAGDNADGGSAATDNDDDDREEGEESTQQMPCSLEPIDDHSI